MKEQLWGVVYLPEERPAAYLDSCLNQLERFTGHQLLLSANPELLLDYQVNILAPRLSGSLGAWLSVWLDTPPQSILFLQASEPPPSVQNLSRLAADRGRHKLLTNKPLLPSPAYYSRACQGAAQRLYRQGERDLAVLLKVLKAPSLL